MNRLLDRLRLLDGLDNESGDEKRRRGFRLEELLRDLFEAEDLYPRIRFRPTGEEIDGSFCLGERTFLLEAKWHSTPLPASAIYAFRGKIDGKLVGTVGVFLSMSGYSTEAVDALTCGKLLNVILFDRDDLFSACSTSSGAGFTEVLRAKLRAAAEEGIVYFTEAARQLERRILSEGSSSAARRVAIVCEGALDAQVLKAIVDRTSLETASPRIVCAQGKLATAPFANSLVSSLGESARVIVVVDSDGDPEGSASVVGARLADPSQVSVVIAHPTVEAWVGSSERLHSAKKTEISQLVQDLDLDELAERSPSFVQFREALQWALQGV